METPDGSLHSLRGKNDERLSEPQRNLGPPSLDRNPHAYGPGDWHFLMTNRVWHRHPPHSSPVLHGTR